MQTHEQKIDEMLQAIRNRKPFTNEQKIYLQTLKQEADCLLEMDQLVMDGLNMKSRLALLDATGFVPLPYNVSH